MRIILEMLRFFDETDFYLNGIVYRHKWIGTFTFLQCGNVKKLKNKHLMQEKSCKIQFRNSRLNSRFEGRERLMSYRIPRCRF